MMESMISTGSPELSKNSSPQHPILETKSELRPKMTTVQSGSNTPNPLQTSKFGNLQPQLDDMSSKPSQAIHKGGNPSAMDNILARLRANDGPTGGNRAVSNPNSTPTLDRQSTESNITLKKQKSDIGPKAFEKTSKETVSGGGGVAISTPVSIDTKKNESAEMVRIRQELAAAKSVINRQEKELAESRTIKQTMESVDMDLGDIQDISGSTVGPLPSGFNATARPFTARGNAWISQDDARSDNSDGVSLNNYDRSRSMYNTGTQFGFGAGFGASLSQPTALGDPRYDQSANVPWNSAFGGQAMLGQSTVTQAQRLFSGPTLPTMGLDGRFPSDSSTFATGNGYRRSTTNYTRPSSGFGSRNQPFGNVPGPMNNLLGPQMSPSTYSASLSFPTRGDLSPTASEFSLAGMNPGAGPSWAPITNPTSQTYVSPLEPLNYRRLLDKNVTCDWKYIVDKIVCNNDQQASIFLQQKLKVGTAEQKYDIVEAIVNQAYPLMINRFGNFLVQRCFEHGTPDQVVAIASAIHGNVLSLSMDAFGCHVIQKAFDSVPETHKADMVRELLRRIPDTVIHRYACHVWQKLFELRWSGEPPQIMSKVNEALRGMWHEVALGETGSLVVQNIFENCVEEEKRPAIEEVIANIDLIAHGQFGNWCIQHLCEHAAPADKRRVIDHILTNAYNYSIDQFASKVVEKCLKIGGTEFLERYLGVITTAHPDRPRIPLIDISGDQYGNYLIQWILMNAQYHQREQVAIHIRKHMVSLRGSKFGSRVAMLCCNPAQVTRPGPGVIVNPFGAPGQPRGWGRFR